MVPAWRKPAVSGKKLRNPGWIFFPFLGCPRSVCFITRTKRFVEGLSEGWNGISELGVFSDEPCAKLICHGKKARVVHGDAVLKSEFQCGLVRDANVIGAKELFRKLQPFQRSGFVEIASALIGRQNVAELNQGEWFRSPNRIFP